MSPFRATTAPMARLGLLLFLIIFGLLTPSLAQVTTTITPDGSLGTTVSQSGAVHTIDGGTILGPNQFHSFGRFDVGSGDTARFTGPASVENILSRVTGGAASMIDGTLQSDIAGANLYLLNPSGVMFGPNARLDVTGSFHVSTADVIQLQDGGSFAATQPELSVLTVAAPSAFGFLQNDPAGIRIEGSHLDVLSGQELSIIGGDIDIVGNRNRASPATLDAPSGQLQLVSVASQGEVLFQPSTAGAEIALEQIDRFGSITIMDDALIDIRGDSGGTVRVRSAELRIDDSQIQTETGDPSSFVSIDMQVEILTMSSRGRLSASGGTVSIVATNQVTLDSSSRVESIASGFDNAGPIVLETGRLQLSGNSRITSETTVDSLGDTSQITIRANRIEMSGSGTRIRGVTRGRGDAAGIVIETEYLRLKNRSRIQGAAFTGSTGEANGVEISATTLIVENEARITSTTSGTGDVSDVRLSVRDLTVQSGGLIASSVGSAALESGFPSGNAGRVVIQASGQVVVTGKESEISSSTNGTGNAGQILIEADQLFITSRGTISTETETGGAGGMISIRVNQLGVTSGSAITSDSSDQAIGEAGHISIQADRIEISGSSTRLRSITRGSGNGGSVQIEAAYLKITKGGRIQGGAFTGSTGDAGTVVIIADTLIVEDEGSVTSLIAGPGNGGRVDLSVHDLTVQSGGRIASSADSASLETGFASGDSGTIMIRASGVVRVSGQDSEISGLTRGTGNAGQGIHLSRDNLLLSLA